MNIGTVLQQQPDRIRVTIPSRVVERAPAVLLHEGKWGQDSSGGCERVRRREGGGVGMGERAADRQSEGEGVGERAGRVSLQKHWSS